MRREDEFRVSSIELCGNFQQEVRNSVLEFRRKVKARAVLMHKSKKIKSVCGMNSLTWKKGKQRRGAGQWENTPLGFGKKAGQKASN